MSFGGRSSLAVLFRVLVAVGVLALLFVKIPAREVWEAMGRAQSGYLAGAFGLTFVMELAIALRLKWFVEAHAISITTPRVLAINLSSRFYALGLPIGNAFALVLRVRRMVQGSGRYADVAASVLLDRLSTSAAMSAFGFVAWSIERSETAEPGMVLAFAALLASALYTLALCWHSLPRIARFVARVENRVPGKYREILRSAAPARDPLSLTVRTWGMSLFVHAVGTIATWLFARSIGIDAPVLAIAWVRSVGLLAAGLPVSFAGLGVREGVYVVLLSAYGVAAPEALALSLISFGVVVLGIGLLGAALELRRALPRWRTE